MVDNVAVISDPRHSYMGWGAVFAGALVAAAISFLLLAFAASIGLSVVSPWSARNPEPQTFGLLAAAWFLIVAACSFWAGGYVAGRMRKGWDDITVEEHRSRDGFHGLVVWAIGVILFIQLGISTAVAVATGAEKLASPRDSSAQTYLLDTMFRRTPGEAPATERWSPLHRDEAARILVRSVGPDPVSTADRSYLAQVVMYEAGVSREEADQRVDNAIVTAKKNADAARKSGVLAGFLTVAGLLIAAAASWLGAVKGGRR